MGWKHRSRERPVYAACRDGECFVTDDRFRFLSISAGVRRMGVFDAESSVNSSPRKAPFIIHSANYLR